MLRGLTIRIRQRQVRRLTTLTLDPSARILPLSNNYARDDGFRSATLIFSEMYALDDGFDGGVLEVSVDGGPFQDILATGTHFLEGGYNGTISTVVVIPRWSQDVDGNSGGFIQTL